MSDAIERATAPYVRAIASDTPSAPIVTQTTLEAGLVLAADGPGQLLDARVLNTGTVAGYLMVLDSPTLMANGTLGAGVILDAAYVAGPGNGALSYSGAPLVFANGCTLTFSSTAPPVKTAVAAWFSGRATID